jgi:hypothetical protein
MHLKGLNLICQSFAHLPDCAFQSKACIADRDWESSPHNCHRQHLAVRTLTAHIDTWATLERLMLSRPNRFGPAETFKGGELDLAAAMFESIALPGARRDPTFRSVQYRGIVLSLSLKHIRRPAAG